MAVQAVTSFMSAVPKLTSLDFFLPPSLEAQFSAASSSAVLEYNGPCNPVSECQDPM